MKPDPDFLMKYILARTDTTMNAVLYKTVVPSSKRHKYKLSPEKDQAPVRFHQLTSPVLLVYNQNKICLLLQTSHGFISWVTICPENYFANHMNLIDRICAPGVSFEL